MQGRFGTQSSKWDVLPADPRMPYIALSVADMDLPCSPAIRQAVVDRASLGLYGYTDLPEDHTEVVADWLERRHGWSTLAKHIVPAHRIVQVVALLLRALTEPEDDVVLFTPSYSPLEKAITLNERHPIRVPLELVDGRYELDRDATEKAMREARCLLLVNPHNPTGKVWTADELAWIAERVERHGLFVLSDDIHAAFTFPGRGHRFLAEFDGAHRTYTFTAPAKTFNMPGLETTHVIVDDDDLRQTLEHELNAAGFHNPNFFSDAATRAAYEDSDQWLAETREVIAANLDRLRAFVARTPGLELIEPEGTFLAWIDARALGASEAELAEWWVERSHVVPSFGTDFGPEYEGFIRVNLAALPELFIEAMGRLEADPTNTKE